MLNFRQMVDLDLAYIERWSIWLDILILLRTPLVVLTGRGAN
jgi:lipopolysaccharide/colanic/teichoic acid biosynthesis glycosyltransferase